MKVHLDPRPHRSAAVRSPKQKHYNGTQNRQVATNNTFNRPGGTANCHRGPGLASPCLFGRQLGRTEVNSCRSSSGAVAGSPTGSRVGPPEPQFPLSQLKRTELKSQLIPRNWKFAASFPSHSSSYTEYLPWIPHLFPFQIQPAFQAQQETAGID